MLLGTQGWRRFVQIEDKLREAAANSPLAASQESEPTADEPISAEDEDRTEAVQRLIAMEGTQEFPTLYDNLSDIEEKYEADVAENYNDREAAVVSIGYISFYGGAVLLVVLIIMGILQVARDVRFWMPVGIAALACLVAGGLWMGAKVDEHGKLALTGFAGFDASKLVALTEPAGESPQDEYGLDPAGLAGPGDDDILDAVPVLEEESPIGGEPDELAEVDELLAEDAAILPPADPQPAPSPRQVNHLVIFQPRRTRISTTPSTVPRKSRKFTRKSPSGVMKPWARWRMT